MQKEEMNMQITMVRPPEEERMVSFDLTEKHTPIKFRKPRNKYQP
jgi:hypothetical protein